jgi:hypothetical protein
VAGKRPLGTPLVEKGVRGMNERERDNAQGTHWLVQLLALLTVPMLAMAAIPPFDLGWLSRVASVLAGAFIGLLISWYYSQKASKELKDAAEELRQLGRLSLKAQEEERPVEFVKEGEEYKGLKRIAKGTPRGKTDVTVRAQVRREGGAPTRGEVGT